MTPNPVLAAFGRPFRLGVAGGAPPSMFGAIHRTAAALDGRFVVSAAALSSRSERARAEGLAIGLPEARCYGSVEDMIASETARPDGIEALAIVTPNDSHARYLRAAAEAGLDVMVEKPLCNDLPEARDLAVLVRRTGIAAVLTHTFSGYPMVRDMRARVRGGEIGAVRLVHVEYLNGSIARPVEQHGDKRWRLDPAISGPSLVLGDIGTHAHHLVSFVTGLPFEDVSAEVGALVPGRRVHDFASVRFHLRGGVRGRLDVSNAAAGMSNQLFIRVFGERGHIEWQHRRHTRLVIGSLDGDLRTVGAGQSNLTGAGLAASRFSRPGHPEGLHEAVANLYRGLADAMLARRGFAVPDALGGMPSVDDGVAGLAFVMACLDSDARGGALTFLPSL